MRKISRRDFLALIPPSAVAVLGSVFLAKEVLAFTYLEPIDPETNPLVSYPNRDWEKVYRDIFSADYTFHYLCAPNDTHGCLLKASVKNGILRWVDPSFKYKDATDLYGNTASARWDPRICVSGLTYARRFYSDRRVKGAFVRKGFKAWVEDGFPRDPETGLSPKKYHEGRGKEDWFSVTWDEAFSLVAKGLVNIVETYSGNEGTERLRRQEYDPTMVDKTGGAGTRTVKVRGGMPLLGPMRIGGIARFANMLALLDARTRQVSPTDAKGGRVWDSYTWHTDLPPGHPMVCGNQTVDFDLYTVENARVITLWGKNWISTKMVDAHWLTEARLHGAKIITIATEYQSTSHKADEVIIIRPAMDTALALGLAHIIIRENLFDEAYVKSFTDLPLLVRMDTLKKLNARDLSPDYKPAELENYVKVFNAGEPVPPPSQQGTQFLPSSMREEWGDFTVWDSKINAVRTITRDNVGDLHTELGVDPALEGEFEVTLADGTSVRVKPVFELVKQYLLENFDPDSVSEMTWAPKEAIISLAHTMAANKGSVIFMTGMGPNQFLNGDLKDRAIFLVASLTNNIGNFGGTVGSYAGNYRLALFPGIGQYFLEDPFNQELNPAKPAKIKRYLAAESAHYYDYGDRPLRVGNKLFTGSTHIPTPTKVTWWSNTNSILGNAKWAHDVMMNTIPKIEMMVVNEWFWTATCEYADVVFGVDSWAERKLPDIYAAVTNPFLSAAPRTPLPRIFDTKDDIETYAAVAAKLSDMTGDERFRQHWYFVFINKVEAYINRVFQVSNTTKGYTFEELEERCKQGIPFYNSTRTSPRVVGWEQTHESKPWYSKSGRLEFYRDEDEWIEYGENLPVCREPSDSTPYEPFVIIAKPNSALRPKQPESYGLDPNDLSVEVRQVRNVPKPWSEVKNTKHPLVAKGYTHPLYTPKYRHACHSMGASTDIEAAFFGPFGDFYRHDKRTPWVSEGYVDLNPFDAKERGIEDGDYIWVDGDPSDRPFRGWQSRPQDYKVTRWLVRARYYPNIPRKTARAWFHFYVSTHGSVEGHENRPDGLAKNPRTGYQAAYRYGSHQSITRAWLRTTLMTDSLVRQSFGGQVIGKGFAADINCANGAPREAFVKITRAEPGGIGGQGLWHPVSEGFRPTYENEIVKRYLAGEYVIMR